MTTVLVIDDDPAMLRTVRFTLESGGFDVLTAENGSAGLSVLEEQLPDLILLDLDMPVMDGETFFRAIRQKGVEVPVVILSAYEARAAQKRLNAEAAVNKPFDPERLVLIAKRLSAA